MQQETDITPLYVRFNTNHDLEGDHYGFRPRRALRMRKACTERPRRSLRNGHEAIVVSEVVNMYSGRCLISPTRKSLAGWF
jgi:hypothetical protein